MSDIPLGSLLLLLVLLLALSGFFSSTETAMMSLNRYRLRHRASTGHVGARLAEQLLSRPDRLIGLILLGNNLVNILAASLVTIISMRIGGEPAIAVGALLLTVALLIFSDVAPKTYGALYPERLALPASYVYTVLMKVAYPVVWVVNLLANGVLRLIGISAEQAASHSLSTEELRTVVAEASTVIPHRHQRMLLSILDLERISVDDIMVPRNEIAGIDLADPWDEIVEQIGSTPHTRMPVYDEELENLVGMLHMKRIVHELANGELTRERLIDLARAREPYFVTEVTPLNTQLVNFQRQRRRIAFVVDEYGDIQGLVTLEDILEEIVGEFTTDPGEIHRDVHRDPDGSYVVSGTTAVRSLNRRLGWALPTDGPRTLNGLIVEQLERIPEAGTVLNLGDYAIEILQTSENAVKTARVRPPARTG
ncbi:MAG TPA: HlyC/CorC family transporter [Steroidobacteraceae bacterium]|nr:HlyC/CorC family transporter [Steroidobacteraceae bacterium]